MQNKLQFGSQKCNLFCILGTNWVIFITRLIFTGEQLFHLF